MESQNTTTTSPPEPVTNAGTPIPPEENKSSSEVLSAEVSSLEVKETVLGGEEIAKTEPMISSTTHQPFQTQNIADQSTPDIPQKPIVDGLTAAENNIYTEICSQIIREQEQIIGVLAIEQATYVEGLTIDPSTYRVTLTGNGSQVIDALIEKYRDFFGHAAVEVCKDAAAKYLQHLPIERHPLSLR